MLVSLDFFRTIIDRIVDDLKTTKDKLQLLQPKITGQSGQVVGFDSDGNVVATDKPSYTAQEVGALPATTAIPSTATDVNAEPIGSVSQHDASDAAHSDIRLLIRGLSERLSAVVDSDDATLDQLSEIVAYIKSNKSLIDAITTSKVNVADIVNDLTTSVANKPLSAAQGVAIKKLIDAITVPTALSELSEDANHRVVTDAEKAVWNAKSNFSGSYNDLTDKPTIPDVPVQSVNGKTGAVALSAVDVGALPDSTVIPPQYTLPIASSTQLGGVQPAEKTDTMTQSVGVDEAGGLWTVPGSGGGSEEAGYKDAVNLLDVTLDDTTGGLKYYEYDVSGIEKTDVIIINILFPASYSGVINIKNQSNEKLTDEFPNGDKGIVVVLKAMNGRYLHSAVSSSNTAARFDAPLSLFYGQINGASGFDRPKAQDAITKIKFGLSAAFAPGTRIRIYRW